MFRKQLSPIYFHNKNLVNSNIIYTLCPYINLQQNEKQILESNHNAPTVLPIVY